MRSSELREFVLELLKNGETYTKDEIEEKVKVTFGSEKYTDKQVRDLLYNMKRVDIIRKDKENKYSFNNMNERKVDNFRKEQNKELLLEENINKSKIICETILNELDGPKLLKKLRHTKYDMKDVERLYEAYDDLLCVINSLNICSK